MAFLLYTSSIIAAGASRSRTDFLEAKLTYFQKQKPLLGDHIAKLGACHHHHLEMMRMNTTVGDRLCEYLIVFVNFL